MSQPDPTPLARALGRIPTGLYVVTSRAGDQDLGLVGSLLMQVGLDPPTVCVAVGKGRDHLAAIRGSGSFAVTVLAPEETAHMGAFFKKYEGGETPFDHVPVARSPKGNAVIEGALAWFECEVTGEHETGDHVVVFGTVRDGALGHDGEPAIHLRTNGLGY